MHIPLEQLLERLMTKYVSELVELLPVLSTNQIDAFSKGLGLDDIKIIRANLLSQFGKDHVAFREHFANCLKEQEQILKLKEASSTHVVGQSVTKSMEKFYQDVTMGQILSQFKNAKVIGEFVKIASNEQLYILQKALKDKASEGTFKNIFDAVEQEQKARAEEIGPEKAAKAKRIIEEQANLQWEAGIWKTIGGNIERAELLLKTNDAEPYSIPEEKPGFFKRVWRAIFGAPNPPQRPEALSREQLEQIYSHTEVTTNERGETVEKPVMVQVGYKSEYDGVQGKWVHILDESTGEPIPEMIEASKLRDRCLTDGAGKISRDIGETSIDGRVAARERGRVIKTMQARFGMSIAQQMVASSELSGQGKMMKVSHALMRAEDSKETSSAVRKALRKVTKNKSGDYPIKPKTDHIFATGGQSYLVTDLEAGVVEKLLQGGGTDNPYGIKLEDQDLVNLQKYQQSIQNGNFVNKMLRDFIWEGPYESQGDKLAEVSDPVSRENKRIEFETKLKVTSQELLHQCVDLKDGQAINLDTGLDLHAMQLVIKKVGDNYKLTTYDSSGALDRATKAKTGLFFPKWRILPDWIRGRRVPNIFGLLARKLFGYGENTVTKNGYSITIPKESLECAEGREYLSELIRSNTRVGWAEQREKLRLDEHLSMSDAGDMSWLKKRMMQMNRGEVYLDYMEKFKSIAPKGAKMGFENVYQRPQNTNNCFAKKAQACELYELGRPTYKKLRKAILQEHRAKLIEDAMGRIDGDENGDRKFLDADFVKQIQDQKPELLSPEELLAVSSRLSELEEPPSADYYQKFFNSIIESRQNLIDLNAEPPLKYHQELLKDLCDKRNKIIDDEKLGRSISPERQRKLNKLNNDITAEAVKLYNDLKTKGQDALIKEIFDESVTFTYNDKDKQYVCSEDVMPLKTDPDSGYITEQAFEKLVTHMANTAEVDRSANQLAIERLTENVTTHAKEFFEYLQAAGKNDLIKEYFNLKPDVVKTEGFTWEDVQQDGIPLKMEGESLPQAALLALSKHSAAQSWSAIIKMIDHQILKIDVNERYLNNESEKAPDAKSSTAMRTVEFADLQNAKVARYHSKHYFGFKLKSNIKVEVEINGEVKQIEPETYFRLVEKFDKEKGSLTDPKIMPTLDYLRNASPSIDQSYRRILYAKQVQAFKTKLKANIEKMEQDLGKGIDDLNERIDHLSKIQENIVKSLKAVKMEVEAEKRLSGDRPTTKLINLQQQQALLEKDNDNIDKLIKSARHEIGVLNNASDIVGSPKAKIEQAKKSLLKLQSSDNLKTINEVSREFVDGQNYLNAVASRISEAEHKTTKLDVVEAVNTRIDKVKQYRTNIIQNHL